MRTAFNLACAVVTCALLLTIGREALAQSVVYDDGGSHVIDLDASRLTVSDPAAGGMTSVRLIGNSDVAHASMHGQSELQLDSGHISHIHSQDDSELSGIGGDISHVNVRGRSTAIFHGGEISHVRAYDQGHVTIHGGSFSHASTRGAFGLSGDEATNAPSLIDIYGGTVGSARAERGGVLNIYGGAIGGAGAATDGTLNVFGGQISSVNPYNGTSVANVYGGLIGNFSPGPDATVHLFGTGLHVEFKEFIHPAITDSARYRITGRLLDGTPLDATADLPFPDFSGALQFHPIPEPAAIQLAAAGAAAGVLTWRARRKRRI
jgi:hypothetical protein